MSSQRSSTSLLASLYILLVMCMILDINLLHDSQLGIFTLVFVKKHGQNHKGMLAEWEELRNMVHNPFYTSAACQLGLYTRIRVSCVICRSSFWESLLKYYYYIKITKSSN